MTKPAKPRDLSGPEQRAQVRRDNAFKDLAAIVNKIQGPMLTPVPLELLTRTPSGDVPIKVIVHQQPGSLSEMVAQLMHKEKQLEIALNVLTSMILEKDLVNIVEYMDRCAQSAEETASLMTRGLLSQGAQPGSIIRRN